MSTVEPFLRNPSSARPTGHGGTGHDGRGRSRRQISALQALALWLCVIGAGAPGAAAAASWDKAPAVPPTSYTARQVAQWVTVSGDNRGLPFAVIDKVTAEVAVYGADGQLRGTGAALLGFARGDGSTPGVGDRELSDIAPEERTTPAGRFLAAYGPATGGKKVLWVDYATAISLHPVVTANRKERRLQRLKSPAPDDNRITFGCINVAAGFYENVVRPSFTGTNGVVYILPESEPLEAALPAYRPPPEAPAPTEVAAAPTEVASAPVD